MNLIFLRHGEATDNVKEIISDKEIYWSTLTEKGKETIKNSIKYLPDIIDKIYVSPFPRTIETAHYVLNKYHNTELIIENRIREINSGKYSHNKNNLELDNTRIKQKNGDFFIRFGEYGDNKYSIEERLCNFLKDVYDNNFYNNNILIISHGSVISYMKRILNLKSEHINKGKVEEFKNVNFEELFNHIKKLKKLKLNKIKSYKKIIENIQINKNLKNNLIKMVTKEFNNLDFKEENINYYLDGLSTKKLIKINNSKFDNGIILICFYNNFEILTKKWIEHYIQIGIKNFVLINNNSTDNSTRILKEYMEKVNISFWKIDEEYNSIKINGWKQQLFEYYGENKLYLTVNQEELLIYENFKKISLNDLLIKEKVSNLKSLILNTYPNKNIYESNLKDYIYVDNSTYKISNKVPYRKIFLGGPLLRKIGISNNLQKISLIKYTGNEICINDNFYYPYEINNEAKFNSYLLNYEILFFNKKNEENDINFFDKIYSTPIDNIDFKFINN